MKRANKSIVFCLLLIGLILVNAIAIRLPFQIDFTEAKLYTLSEGSRDLLSKIKDPIHLKFYFNRGSEGLPILFKSYADRIQELLFQYTKAANGKLTLEIIDPKPDTKEEESAIRVGIAGQPLPSGETLFFGLLAIQAEKEASIPFFDSGREGFLEYDISQMLYRVQQMRLPKIGIISSLDVIGTNAGLVELGMSGIPDWVFVEELRKNFEIEKIDIDQNKLPEDIDLLAIIHPQKLRDPLLYAIDQFLLAGNPIFMALDPSSYLRRSQTNPQAMMSGASQNISSDLSRLLDKWGISYDPLKVVGDLTYAASVNPSQGGSPVRFPVWLDIDTFNEDKPPTSDLNTMLLPEAGSLSLKTGSQLQLTSLIESSGNNSLLPASLLMLSNIDQVTRQIKPTNERLTIAGLIKGEFPTAFPEGKPKEEGEDAPSVPENSQANGLKKSSTSSTLVLVADTDFLVDDFSVRKINFLGFSGIQPINDNLAFMHNIIEFLSGSEDLISLRSKGTTVRPFEQVNAIEAAAQQSYQTQLVALEGRLKEVQQKINELQSRQGEQGELVASPEVREAIQEFRVKEAQMRSERREIRKKLREDVEALERDLALFNLIPVPLAVIACGIIYFIKRNRRQKRQ